MNQEWSRIKARKDHKCDWCDELILKDDEYDYYESRAAKYDDNDNQVGIDYFKCRTHKQELNCNWPDECKKGNHSKIEYHDGDPYSSDCGEDFIYCENCGTNLTCKDND